MLGSRSLGSFVLGGGPLTPTAPLVGAWVETDALLASLMDSDVQLATHESEVALIVIETDAVPVVVESDAALYL